MRWEDAFDFVTRPREPVAALKRAAWAGGSATEHNRTSSALAAGHALYLHALRLGTKLNSRAQRAEDLEAHVRLKKLLDRAAPAFTVRKRPR